METKRSARCLNKLSSEKLCGMGIFLYCCIIGIWFYSILRSSWLSILVAVNLFFLLPFDQLPHITLNKQNRAMLLVHPKVGCISYTYSVQGPLILYLSHQSFLFLLKIIWILWTLGWVGVQVEILNKIICQSDIHASIGLKY